MEGWLPKTGIDGENLAAGEEQVYGDRPQGLKARRALFEFILKYPAYDYAQYKHFLTS
jgi:hypothetical protein